MGLSDVGNEDDMCIVVGSEVRTFTVRQPFVPTLAALESVASYDDRDSSLLNASINRASFGARSPPSEQK
jgi:hypothetical protein